MIPTLLGHIGLPLLVATLVVAAISAYLYLPVLGRPLAAGLAGAAVALTAYTVGFNERGALDQSAVLKAQIETLKANAATAQRAAANAAAIAKSASDRETAAEKDRAAAQDKVTQYEIELAKRQAPACALTDDDVKRLRDIGPSSH